ncbi:phage antirepressor KilAC domain-containing protein [Prescottella equi]|uniref:phage antirepressor KilAC domain-containing protein n=1 Tax=Rhodococcus hoagii TaxID=43767 RepID=UPI0020C64975|nr:phage antirepressor KilAC domain-containing protein [Prescottella equi]
MTDSNALAVVGEMFEYDELNTIRTVDIDGRRWAVAADICRTLDIKDVRQAVERLDEADRCSTPIRSGKQNRRMWCVSQDGATDLVLESRKPEAKKFRRFLTHEVWPSIRDTGSYNSAPALTGAELMAAALVEANKTLAVKDAAIAELAPKAAYVDEFVTDSDLLSFRTVASTLGVAENELRKLLITNNWIYVETASRWSESKQVKETINRYSEYSHKKSYFRRIEEHKAPRFRGEVMHTLKITPPGAHAIARCLPRWIEEAA